MSAYRPHSAPSGDERETLRREIVTQAQQIGSRVPEAKEDEVEVLIDEALVAARGKRG